MSVYTQHLVRRYLTTRVIPLIAVGAVGLCVALVVIVVSVMTGFLDTLKASGRTLMGDVVINYPVQGIPYYPELIADLRALPDVEACTPIVDSWGLLRMPYPHGPRKDVVVAQVWGIEPESFRAVTSFDDCLYWRPPADAAEADAMKPDDPRRTLDGTLLEQGRTLRADARGGSAAVTGMHVSILNKRQDDGSYRRANANWWMPEHEITITLIPISDRGTVSQSSNRVFPVVNEVMSGVHQVDKSRVFVPIADAQEMLRLDAAPVVDTSAEPDADGKYPLLGISPARATQILVRAKPGVTPTQLQASVARAYEAFYVRKASDPTTLVSPPALFDSLVQTWEQRLADLIGPVEKERQMMRVLFSITYLVCAGLILAIFWSIVSEKTRDIGIMRAVGASRAGVQWIFLMYGLVIGVVGSAFGLALGWVVVMRINSIHEMLGHDAPKWTWITVFALAGGAAVLAIRAFIGSRALASLLWVIATLALAALATGLMLHRGFLMWDPAVYYFSRIPSQVDWWSAGGTAIGAIVFSVLGAAVPAAKAADIDPVRALRYE